MNERASVRACFGRTRVVFHYARVYAYATTCAHAWSTRSCTHVFVYRISETYGEDPFLSGAMGQTATIALQQRVAPAAPGGVDFLATSQVTRHFMGVCGLPSLSRS